MYQEFGILMNICGALRDLVPFVQLKKREKYPWRSVNFSLKLTFLHGCFSRFLNCTIGTKSRNALHLEDFFCNVSLTQYLSYKFC